MEQTSCQPQLSSKNLLSLHSRKVFRCLMTCSVDAFLMIWCSVFMCLVSLELNDAVYKHKHTDQTQVTIMAKRGLEMKDLYLSWPQPLIVICQSWIYSSPICHFYYCFTLSFSVKWGGARFEGVLYKCSVPAASCLDSRQAFLSLWTLKKSIMNQYILISLWS